MSCSCPDWADMCKHIAATLYGVGNRLDRTPELLFKLRQVDHLDLIAQAIAPAAGTKRICRKTIADDQLTSVFGIELEESGEAAKSNTAKPAKLNGRGKPVASEKKKAVRTAKAKKQEEAAPTPKRSARARKKVLTSADRKRIAQELKDKWQALNKRQALKSSGEAPTSPAPAKKSAKAKAATSTRGKSSRRRSVVI
jgi:uncharacterized Zn finger protein